MGGKNKPGYKPPKLQYSRDRKKYERQPGETPAAWRVFCLYKELGYQRTLRKATKIYLEETGSSAKLSAAENNTAKWSSRNRWRERIVEWDNHIDAKRRRGQEEEILRMRVKHVKMGESLQVAGVKALNAWMRVREMTDFVDVKLSDIVKAVQVGIQIERQGREEPDIVVEQKMTVKQEKIRDRMRDLLNEDEFGPAVDMLMKATNESSPKDAPN